MIPTDPPALTVAEYEAAHERRIDTVNHGPLCFCVECLPHPREPAPEWDDPRD